MRVLGWVGWEVVRRVWEGRGRGRLCGFGDDDKEREHGNLRLMISNAGVSRLVVWCTVLGYPVGG